MRAKAGDPAQERKGPAKRQRDSKNKVHIKMSVTPILCMLTKINALKCHTTVIESCDVYKYISS